MRSIHITAYLTEIRPLSMIRQTSGESLHHNTKHQFKPIPKFTRQRLVNFGGPR